MQRNAPERNANAPERKLISAMWLELRPCLGRFRAEICKGALKPRQIGEIAQALATLIAADGFADSEELSLARAVLPDACAHCGAPPAAQRRSTVGPCDKGVEPPAKSELEAASVEDAAADANQRVEVVHVATGRVVRGSTAPLASSIDAWLTANPGWRTRADVDASAARLKPANVAVAPTSSSGLLPSAAGEARVPPGSHATDADAAPRDGTGKVRRRALSERDSGAVLNKADPVRDGHGAAPPASSPASSPRKRAAAEPPEDDATRPAAAKCRNTGRAGGPGAFSARVLHSDAVGRVRAPRAALNYANALGPRLLGEQVDVWWEAEASWFTGTLSKLDRASGCYSVEYEDGDLEEGLALPDHSVVFRVLGSTPTGPPREASHDAELERLTATLVRDRTTHPHIFWTGTAGSAAHQFLAQLEQSRGSSQVCLVGRFGSLAEAETELERARQRQRAKSPASNAKGGARAKQADPKQPRPSPESESPAEYFNRIVAADSARAGLH